MDIKKLLAELRSERQRVEQAIAALESLDGADTRSIGKRGPGRPHQTGAPTKGGRRKMSPAGRKRISEMMKARWAARKKAAKKA